MKVVLITGANGFIGKNLVSYLNKHYPEAQIKTISRQTTGKDSITYKSFKYGTYQREFLEDVTDIVHLAAIAHQFGYSEQENLDEINIEYPAKLLSVMKQMNLQKFIFLSSISVSLLDQGIYLDTKIYAETKKRAESELIKVHNDSNAQVVIVRPPMVYGYSAPGNFRKLIKLMRFPLPLPFGLMDFNKPAIHVTNLVSALAAIIFSNQIPTSKNLIYEVTDPFKISFAQYLKKLNKAVHGRSLIFPLKLSFLQAVLKFIGKNSLYEKLVLTYVISNKNFEKDFNWPKPITQENMFDDLV